MDLKKLFGYEGKNVVISGSASGMSKAATELLIELGANVFAVDINDIDLPVKQAYKADLSDKLQIDAWIKTLPEKIDCLFLCHGISQFPGKEMLVQKVNFYSQKYITETLLPRISDHGSITYICSVGGFGWQQIYTKALDLFSQPTWDDAMAWYEEHFNEFKDNSYSFAKKCLSSYVAAKCHDKAFIGRKIRVNAINPGDTITGLTEDFLKSTGGGDREKGLEMTKNTFLKSWDGYSSQPQDQGYPLVVIGSDICSYMSGQSIYIDYGITTLWTTMGLLRGTDDDVIKMSKEAQKN